MLKAMIYSIYLGFLSILVTSGLVIILILLFEFASRLSKKTYLFFRATAIVSGAVLSIQAALSVYLMSYFETDIEGGNARMHMFYLVLAMALIGTVVLLAFPIAKRKGVSVTVCALVLVGAFIRYRLGF